MKHVIATIAILWRQLPYSKCLLPSLVYWRKMFHDWSHVNQPTSTCDTNLHAEVTVKYLYFMHFQPFPLPGISAPNIVLNNVVCLFRKVCPIADYEKNICGSPGKKPNIIPSRISSASPHLMCYSAEFPLGAGLIRNTYRHEYLMRPWSAYEPHP